MFKPNNSFCQINFQNLATLESMQLAVDNVVAAIFDGSNDDTGSGSDAQLASCRILEGFLPCQLACILETF